MNIEEKSGNSEKIVSNSNKNIQNTQLSDSSTIFNSFEGKIQIKTPTMNSSTNSMDVTTDSKNLKGNSENSEYSSEKDSEKSIKNKTGLEKQKISEDVGDSLEESNNQDGKKKKKPFVERFGDWVCIKCKNLNFSFRVICNRCQLTKIESDKLFEQYMKNLMNYVKINEIIQNQIMNYPHLNTSFINQMSSLDVSKQGLTEFLLSNNLIDPSISVKKDFSEEKTEEINCISEVNHNKLPSIIESNEKNDNISDPNKILDGKK
jgi:Zn-finger in Ran binding protein and others